MRGVLIELLFFAFGLVCIALFARAAIDYMEYRSKSNYSDKNKKESLDKPA